MMQKTVECKAKEGDVDVKKMGTWVFVLIYVSAHWKTIKTNLYNERDQSSEIHLRTANEIKLAW